MINIQKCPVALALKDNATFNIVETVLAELGFENIASFANTKSALEKALKKQFDLFIVESNADESTGVVFIQKLRESMNYGSETHLYLTNELSPKIMNVLLEYDVTYVLTAPYSQERVKQKLSHVIKTENELTLEQKLYREAKTLYFNGFHQGTIEAIEKIHGTFAPNEKTHLLLGDSYLAERNLILARTHYQLAKNINPKSVLATQKLGVSYMTEKNFLRASELLDSVTELNPYNLSLLVNAGLTNYEIGKPEKAKQNFTAVTNLDEKNKAANEGLANIAIDEKDYDSLVANLGKSHSEKEFVAFLNAAGIKLAKENDYPGAIKLYERCLEHIRNDDYKPPNYFNMGLGYQKMQNY